MQLPLVLAANLETLIGVAFVVIWVISGLLNYMGSRAKPKGPNRAARPARPRNERIQSEIEQFMREQVRRQDGDQPAAQRAEPPAARPVVKPEPRPARRPAARGPAPRPQAKRTSLPQGARPQITSTSGPTLPGRPGEELSHRKSIATDVLGQNLRDHLQTAMVERVRSGAEAHLKPNVSSDVEKHLGVFSGGAVSTTRSAPSLARTLAAELRSPLGMKKALVLQMVLSPPISLQRRSS